MDRALHLSFESFLLDPIDERLWRGSDVIRLRRKTFALLHYLAERPGQLATKDALLDAVWHNAVTTEAVLTESMRELRKTLGDDARAPQFIETVYGRGYRWIANIRSAANPLI